MNISKERFFTELNKYVPIGYLNRGLIFLTDCSLSVFASLFSYVFFHIIIDIKLDNKELLSLFLISSIVSAFWIYIFKTYQNVIRHSTIGELVRIVYAMGMKGLTMLSLALLFTEYVGNFIIAEIFGGFMISVFLLVFVRAFIVNIYHHLQKAADESLHATLIYGTAEAAISLANYLRNRNEQYAMSGFLSRNPQESNLRIAGYPVYVINTPDKMKELLKSQKIKAILFTSLDDLHSDSELTEFCLRHHISLQIAPLMEGQHITHQIQLRNVQIEDLLGRDEIEINLNKIAFELTGKTVFVSGASGSIGSELCRQLCKFPIKKLVLFDNAETPMHTIYLELSEQKTACEIYPVIGDIRNKARVELQFKKHHPDIIFHAAAYKHVPLMEENPCEAVHTNVYGTRILADLAVAFDVDKFIMISTDKAVSPSNVMGASKRIAEIYVQSLSQAILRNEIKGKTRFITTRFGNVLGSNGSVIPRFKSQILAGGPVTVTHPEIIRYFMTIPEACRLVLEAGFMGEGYEIFVFDMGKPVKIIDLARRMIELSGMIPDVDIKIEFSGLRPGEKLYEELLNDSEKTLSTPNKKIFRAQIQAYSYTELLSDYTSLCETALEGNKTSTVRLMKKLVPEFKSRNSEYEKLDD